MQVLQILSITSHHPTRYSPVIYEESSVSNSDDPMPPLPDLHRDPYSLSDPKFLRALFERHAWIERQKLRQRNPESIHSTETSIQPLSISPPEDQAIQSSAKKRKRSDPQSQNFPFHLPLTKDKHYDSLQREWPRSPEDAWRAVSPEGHLWKNMVPYQSILCCIYDIERSLRLTTKAITSRGDCTHSRTISMPLWIFLRFIWDRLLPEERVTEVNSRCSVFRVRLLSLKRIAFFFGCSWLRHEFAQGDRILVAPRARVKSNWQHRMEWPIGVEPRELLSAKQDEFVALLECDEIAWAYQFNQTSRVKVLGLDLQGKYGLIPRRVLEIDRTFTLEYHPNTMRLKIDFPYWIFNDCGVLQNGRANLSCNYRS